MFRNNFSGSMFGGVDMFAAPAFNVMPLAKDSQPGLLITVNKNQIKDLANHPFTEKNSETYQLHILATYAELAGFKLENYLHCATALSAECERHIAQAEIFEPTGMGASC